MVWLRRCAQSPNSPFVGLCKAEGTIALSNLKLRVPLAVPGCASALLACESQAGTGEASGTRPENQNLTEH
jgi:hypothetical protein